MHIWQLVNIRTTYSHKYIFANHFENWINKCKCHLSMSNCFLLFVRVFFCLLSYGDITLPGIQSPLKKCSWLIVLKINFTWVISVTADLLRRGNISEAMALHAARLMRRRKSVISSIIIKLIKYFIIVKWRTYWRAP